MVSIVDKIRSSIVEGKVYVGKDFSKFGKRISISKALFTLTEEGFIERIARGVYVKKIKNPYVGDIYPDPLEVAKKICNDDVIQIQGADAALKMGLTDQVPMRTIFYTSRTDKYFYMGKLKITLKKVSRRKLALAGFPAGEALTALWYLGKDRVGLSEIDCVKDRLSVNEFNKLCLATKNMPMWLRNLFREYKNKKSNNRVLYFKRRVDA